MNFSSSPFDTRNTAISRSAFWSLLVLPDIGDVRSPKELNDEAVYIFRSVMAQTILAAIGGSTEFSVSQVATVSVFCDHKSHFKFGNSISIF